MVDEGWEELGVELHAVDGYVAAGGGVAILAVGFEEAAAVAGDGAGGHAGEVAADDVVAAEGADGSDGVNGGGVCTVVKLFALTGGGFGGEEAAVGGRDEATAHAVEEEGEEGEDVWGGEEVAGACAGAVWGAEGVGSYGF